MKIKWIEFRNVETGLIIKKINFYDDITLLVGLSGVGKTQILNAVEYSLNLAVGKDIILRPYDVSVGICVDNTEYVWSYRIESAGIDDFIFENDKYNFVYESLKKDGKLVFERKQDGVNVDGYEKVPQPKKMKVYCHSIQKIKSLKN